MDETPARDAAGDSSLPLPLVRLLAARGFTDLDEQHSFLDPRLSGLTNPLLLPDMPVAVERIWRAIDAGETITVFGDYDVDGITAAALLTRVLSALGGRVAPFIPDRMDEGYGLSQDALDRCIEECRPSLIITVDCGVNSVDSVADAGQRGIDVVVTDHHQPADETAAPLALVNPKLGNHEELEILAGVGVAFKLAHALVKTGRENGNEPAGALELREYLDFVALGTVADMVPLLNENRILVKHGLAQMYRTRWVGMAALKTVAGLQDEPEAWHLGFQLGPRINAAGRIGQPMESLQLLTTDDAQEARRIAALLDQTNRDRQTLEKTMAEEAMREIDEYYDPAVHFGLVVAREAWHPGVVGIVASRICRKYNRPAIVMGIDEDHHARGSCRSIDEYDILEGLKTCADYLIKFGGHKMAAGVTLAQRDIAAFRQAFNDAAARQLRNLDLSPVQPVDAFLTAGDLDESFMDALKQLQPFGQDNPEPVWALRGAAVQGTPRVVGNSHLKFSVQADGKLFDVIAFNFAPEDLPDGRIDIAFTLTENTWNGTTSLQLQLRDARPAQ